MKKIKILSMILAVALVLSLALGLLVACGETDASNDNLATAPEGETPPSDTPPVLEPEDGGSGGGGMVVGPSSSDTEELSDGPIEATQYFDKFNSLSHSIGTTPIEQGSDLYFHTEFSGLFGMKDEYGPKDEHFELGFEIEAILDRTSKDAAGEFTSQNSAIRARVFSGATDIFAASFFVNDPLSLYIDFAGSRIKLSAEFVYENNNLNEKLGRLIGKALNKEFEFDFGRFDFSFSLNKILDAIVEGTGSEWSPATLLKSLAKLIGFEGEEADAQLSDFGVDDSYVELLSGMLSGIFKATKDGDNYSVILDTRDSGGIMHALFNELLGLDFLFKMNFAEDNGRLKDGVQFEFGLPTLVRDEDFCYPYVAARINLFELLPADGKQISMAAERDEYKGNIAFKNEEALTPDGFKLFGSELREIRYSEAFMLDFVNPIETNRTAAQIKLSMSNAQLGEDVLFDLSFVRGRLAIRLAPQVVFKEGTLIGDACLNALEFLLGKLKSADPTLEAKIADEIYEGGANGAREHIDPNFKGIVVDNISVRDIIDSIVADAVDAYKYMAEQPAPEFPDEETPDAPSYDDWQAPSLSDLQNFSPANIMRNRVLPALGEILETIVKLDDGKINIHTDSVLDLLLNISNDLAGLNGKDRLTQSELFDEAIEGACEALDWLAEKGFIVYDEETPDAMSLLESCYKSLLETFEIKDAPQKLETESYIKYAMRVLLGSTSLDISLDLTDGWSYSFGIGIASATLTYSRSFTTWEGLEVEDLYDEAQNGWLMFDFADLDDFIK